MHFLSLYLRKSLFCLLLWRVVLLDIEYLVDRFSSVLWKYHSIPLLQMRSQQLVILLLCVWHPFSSHAFKIFILVFDFHLVLFWWGWMSLYLLVSCLGFVELLTCVDECLLSNLESFQLLFLETFLLPHSLFWNSDCTYVDMLNTIPNVPLWSNFLVHWAGRGMKGALGQNASDVSVLTWSSAVF